MNMNRMSGLSLLLLLIAESSVELLAFQVKAPSSISYLHKHHNDLNINLISSQQHYTYQHQHQHQHQKSKLCMAQNDKEKEKEKETIIKTLTTEELQAALTLYLQKRSSSNADATAKNQKGKIVGGTKGNAILEFISGAPNKERAIEESPDIFDYDELQTYGFGYLINPIMNAGGRREMYALMNIPMPALKEKKKRIKVRNIVIDREGKNDTARYSGLKMGQVLDDEEMGRQLELSLRKSREGKELKNKLEEESYVQPFADKRNTGPMQTPDWTPERLDEEGKRAGQAMAWARKARAGEFKKDPFEMLNIEGSLQVYSVLTSVFVAVAFGKSTSRLFEILQMNSDEMQQMNGILNLLHGPALAMILASIGSGIFCILEAPAKNRSTFVWAMKGYIGGPVAVLQLRGLEELITQGEADNIRRDEIRQELADRNRMEKQK